LMAGGVIYATAGTRRSVVALDAVTGELLWVHGEREGARGANAPRGLSGQPLAAWLTRVGEARGVSVDCASIVTEVESLADRRRSDLSPLVRIARDIHRWRREIVDGRPRHPRGH